MGSMSARKGRNAERELARILQERGLDVRPGDPCNHGRTPDLFGPAGVHVEVKRREKLDIYAALRQSAADAEKFHDGLPLIAHRSNRHPWIISMSLDTFLAFYERTKSDKTGKGGLHDAKHGEGAASPYDAQDKERGSGGGGLVPPDNNPLF